MVEATAVSNDRIDILVANGTKAPVEVRRGLRIEQRRGDEWFALEAVGPVWIRDECDPIGGVLYPRGLTTQCMTLAPETVIDVSPWLGTVGDAQCACEQCASVPSGWYRIVLTDCQGGRVESDPLVLRFRADSDEG